MAVTPQQPKQRRLVLEWIVNQPSPLLFTQKDFEKRYPGRQPSNIVREHLDALVADGVLELSKCGSINVFYYFKNVKWAGIRGDLENLSGKVAALTRECEALQTQINSMQETRGDFKGKKQLLLRQKELERQVASKKLEISKLRKTRWTPDDIANKTKEFQSTKAQLESLADNIEILVDYLCKKCQVEPSAIRQEFAIPEEFCSAYTL
ncbi:Mnd1p KNAG_0G01270 [Huiozyma naganishii CBS 8797]|uniref:Mnd1 HTH domain-containing protein n=1 Tax=Huiozyma naganishii (strain ATCC MYA-139 / BCRC 22969 / CBS 8797 / KCTC 17520 / NBRC 10181 / NCYC 3082 / Yp74L-3) TaxID=1071383 RepID=J7R8I8_HUIN7|nr:hypothetical protein KNAG_0G01270 [Kazachstania naganishii CBS 8797]CCK71185.1 hypothetical protein KNAG_0G01270 [Kazachstania naganishii CBS 8797]